MFKVICLFPFTLLNVLCFFFPIYNTEYNVVCDKRMVKIIWRDWTEYMRIGLQTVGQMFESIFQSACDATSWRCNFSLSWLISGISSLLPSNRGLTNPNPNQSNVPLKDGAQEDKGNETSVFCLSCCCATVVSVKSVIDQVHSKYGCN